MILPMLKQPRPESNKAPEDKPAYSAGDISVDVDDFHDRNFAHDVVFWDPMAQLAGKKNGECIRTYHDLEVALGKITTATTLMSHMSLAPKAVDWLEGAMHALGTNSNGFKVMEDAVTLQYKKYGPGGTVDDLPLVAEKLNSDKGISTAA
jgi:hypothetical protein